VTTKDIEIARIMDTISKPGEQAIKFSLKPLVSGNIIFTEHTEGFEVKSYTIKGNVTPAVFTGPQTVIIGAKGYTGYSWTFGVEAGRAVNISYKTEIANAGQYNFVSKARFAGSEMNETAVMRVTECASLEAVFASNGKECKKFATPCDVPKGWDIVSGCEEERGGINIIAVIIIAAAIIIIALLAWKFRDEIRVKIEELKSRIRKKKEDEFVKQTLSPPHNIQSLFTCRIPHHCLKTVEFAHFKEAGA